MTKMRMDLDALAVDSFEPAYWPKTPRPELGDRDTVDIEGSCTGVSMCYLCFYTANCCECGSWVS